MKKALIIMLVVLMMMPSFTVNAHEKESVTEKFKDLSKNGWYIDGIQEMYNRELMVGTSEDKYSPSLTVDRATVLAVLYRISGENAEGWWDMHKDVSEDMWYYDTANWAWYRGIVNVPSSSEDREYFDAKAKVPRQRLAWYIHYFVGSPKGNHKNLFKFEDGARTYDYAWEAMGWCIEQGIFSGNANGKLNPRGYTTRAELAQVILKLLEYIESENTVKVTLDPAGGVLDNNMRYIYLPVGSNVDFLPYVNTNVTDRNFNGWYLEGKRLGRFTEFTKDIAVYAGWVDNGIRVTFESYPGVDVEYDFMYVTYGSTFTEFPEARRIGAYYLGWRYRGYPINDETIIDVYAPIELTPIFKTLN